MNSSRKDLELCSNTERIFENERCSLLLSAVYIPPSAVNCQTFDVLTAFLVTLIMQPDTHIVCGDLNGIF